MNSPQVTEGNFNSPRVAKPQVVGIEIDLCDKWRIHQPYPSSWRDFYCLMWSRNFNYEGLGKNPFYLVGIGQSLVVSRDWIYSAQSLIDSLIDEGLGSISSWDWFLDLQSLQMSEKFLFMVPYTKFSQCTVASKTASRQVGMVILWLFVFPGEWRNRTTNFFILR